MFLLTNPKSESKAQVKVDFMKVKFSDQPPPYPRNVPKKGKRQYIAAYPKQKVLVCHEVLKQKVLVC